MEMALFALRASMALALMAFFGVLIWLLVREPNARSSSRPMASSLTRIAPNFDKPARFDLATPTWIGRDPNCAIRLTDDTASARHARIEWRPQEQSWWVEDTSRNGTFVNGERISARALRSGDTLACGDSQFRFDVNENRP